MPADVDSTRQSTSLPTEDQQTARRGLSDRWRISLLRVATLAAFLGLWQLASGVWIDEFLISSPTAVLDRLTTWAADGTLLLHTSATAMHMAGGFVLGSVFGLILGLLLGRNETAAKVFSPFIMAFNSTPKVALAPLFVLWFGIGMQMKVLLVATIVFFMVFMNTYNGVRNVSGGLLAVLRLMGASEKQIMQKVILPSAATWVFVGLRLSVPFSLIGAIIGELIASNRGLGYLVVNASSTFDTAGALAALAAVALLALVLDTTVQVAEKKAMPWKTSSALEDVRV